MSGGPEVSIVGGGPGGLFLATLIKRRLPSSSVTVHERNAADATFGFGVVFSERTLSGFADADPSLPRDLAAIAVDWEDIEVRRDGHRLRCGGHGFSAIARKALLALLHDRAREAGVALHFEHDVTLADVEGADLVVAADGVNSTLRAAREPAFEPRITTGAAKYIWFATPQPFDALTFAFVDDEHGDWAVHAYPFEDGTSTFIVETDEATWRRAGLAQAGDLPPGQSDMVSLRYCEELFAEHLNGHGLLENNSRWANFNTLRCGTWHDGNVALLGDAAHTAHFSVGSGTKMAMEDAAVLADAFAAGGDVREALTRYEGRRRPQVERIQAAAAPSIVWWERFRFLRDVPLERFALHFLTRSPSVTHDRLKSRDRRFVRQIDEWAAAALGVDSRQGPLATPVTVGSLELASRLVIAPGARGRDRIAAVGGAALFGAGLVLIDDEDDEETVAWLHAETPAKAACRLGAGATSAQVARAAAAGFAALAIPLSAEGLGAWPVDRLLLAGVAAPVGSQGEAADEMLRALAALRAERHVAVAVQCGEGGAPGSQLLLCDRIVQELGLPCVLVDAARSVDEAATAVLAGRAALIQGTPSLVSATWAPSAELAPSTASSNRQSMRSPDVPAR